MFIIKSDLSKEKLEEIINNHWEEHYKRYLEDLLEKIWHLEDNIRNQYNACGGMGGEHTVDSRKWGKLHLAPGTHKIDLDNESYATIRFIKDNFEIVDNYSC